MDARDSTTIRRARPAEAAQLTKLAHVAKRHWNYPDSWIELWRDDLTVSAPFIRRNPVFCALRRPRVVGFYALSHSGAEFELEHLWVHPRHMGDGIGSELFRHAVRHVRARRGKSLRIVSDPNARGFYRSMGARYVGRVRSAPAGRYLPLLVLRLHTASS